MESSDLHPVTVVSVEEELKTAYLDYAMSVIVGRALPDARDGLKPVHRRILYAMHVLGNVSNKPHKKCGRIVGDVVGKYHPHGESPIYEALVRMAQPFSLRCPLVDGQGNFGSIDGDPPAAYRYTEARLSPIAHFLLEDLDKGTVDFVPNYDGAETMPEVLPVRFPNLLVNGSAGIAVGMATNVPPHNLGEIVKACIACLDNEAITLAELMQYVPGPDFPTGGTICGQAGIVDAYKTGRGRVIMRGQVEVVSEENGKEQILITELPYQVNKARLIEKMAELVKEKKMEGISGLRDESDREGMRIVLDLKKGVHAQALINQLYQQTALQSSFGVNMVVVCGGKPQLCNLHQLLSEFITHRKTVVTRRSWFEREKAATRLEVVEGLLVALLNIDTCVALIKKAQNTANARYQLMTHPWEIPEALSVDRSSYQLSQTQAQAILELRLHRLTTLERDKLQAEYTSLREDIARLDLILKDPIRLKKVVREELEALLSLSDPRRSRIEAIDSRHLLPEDLIANEAMVVTRSHKGYIKAQALAEYHAQHRGGRGKVASSFQSDDFLESLLVANRHDTLLCFSNQGRVYWLKLYALTAASRNAKGRPLVNFLPLSAEEKITAVLPLPSDLESKEAYIFMATALGVVKKTPIKELSRPRSSGVIAVNLSEDDQLIGVAMTNGQQSILLFSEEGKVVRFCESQVRSMGRQAAGVRGMRLHSGDRVTSLIVPEETQGDILTVTASGYGKRTALSQYPSTSRGALGVISIKVTPRNGKVVGAVQVSAEDDMMLITDVGNLVRFNVGEVHKVGRNTQGVMLIKIESASRVVGLQRILQEGKGLEKEPMRSP